MLCEHLFQVQADVRIARTAASHAAVCLSLRLRHGAQAQGVAAAGGLRRGLPRVSKHLRRGDELPVGGRHALGAHVPGVLAHAPALHVGQRGALARAARQHLLCCGRWSGGAPRVMRRDRRSHGVERELRTTSRPVGPCRERDQAHSSCHSGGNSHHWPFALALRLGRAHRVHAACEDC